jgi:hypothetical protein
MNFPINHRIQYGKALVTPDTANALRQLEKRAATLKNVRLSITGPRQDQMSWSGVRVNPGPTGLPPEWSAVPTGREVYLGIEILEDALSPESRTERSLATLWGLAVPLGFVPYTRYPLPGPCQAVFHFVGPWSILMDHLLAVGRGEAAWPGFCSAAQVEVGAWEGSHATERYVQSQLHRLGYNSGAIDGIVANNTIATLKAAGYAGKSLAEVAEQIGSSNPTSSKPVRVKEGSLDLGEVGFFVSSYGQVRTVRTPKGAQFAISGAGRIVIDVQE